MTENEFGIEKPLKSANHVQTAEPSSVIPRKPTMGVGLLIVIRHMELVGGPDESTVFLEVDLHHAQARRVSR